MRQTLRTRLGVEQLDARVLPSVTGAFDLAGNVFIFTNNGPSHVLIEADKHDVYVADSCGGFQASLHNNLGFQSVVY